MDEFWYEWRPFLFLSLGAASLYYGQGNKLLTASGIILFFASGFTLKARLDYRKKKNPKRKT